MKKTYQNIKADVHITFSFKKVYIFKIKSKIRRKSVINVLIINC